jgi:dephospho-CoA kinase
MIVLGLTGSIGMGKSTVASMLRRMVVPVYDADAAVRKVMARPRAHAAIAAVFPGALVAGKFDRRMLGELALAAEGGMGRLEAILHPLVRAEMEKFLRVSMLQHRKIVALDIPLLFENGLERYCDYTLVVSAPPFVQRARVLSRPGMDAARFRAILARQMPDAEKRRRGDFVVRTGCGRGETKRQIDKIILNWLTYSHK